jgi:hypothetical protein
MNTNKMIISIILATLSSAAAIDTATAQVRNVRARNMAKGAALTSTSETRPENQENRQERWNQASPNQKAVTYNVAKTGHQQKLTNQANAAAALSKRR